MTITKIGLVEKKELNEEFFNQVFPGKEIKTEEDFRNAIKEAIATTMGCCKAEASSTISYIIF